MDKKILYIGGGFDILHVDHKRFIMLGIERFSGIYETRPEVVIGLKPDCNLNLKKGECRPFFSYEWRSRDVSDFLEKAEIKHSVILTTHFSKRFKDKESLVAQVRSDYPEGHKEMERMGVSVMGIKPTNEIHTSFFEKSLFEAQMKSNCNLRKVGSLLLRQGKIVAEGFSGSGDCDCCGKSRAYREGGSALSKKVECDYPHAEEAVLAKAEKGDDILITDSPCQKCAELIVRKGIRRVVYLKNYHNLEPVGYLEENGIGIRESGINQ